MNEVFLRAWGFLLKLSAVFVVSFEIFISLAVITSKNWWTYQTVNILSKAKLFKMLEKNTTLDICLNNFINILEDWHQKSWKYKNNLRHLEKWNA